MAQTSKCGSCNGTTFEIKETKVNKAAFRYNAIQCAGCGAVVSFTEYMYLTDLLEKISEKLGVR